MFIGITGSNGSNGTYFSLNREVYYTANSYFEDFINDLIKKNKINWNQVTLRTGSSPWIDHMAVQLYLNLYRNDPQNCPHLEIYSSTNLNTRTNTFVGSKGLSVENFHKKFSEKMNFYHESFNSIEMICEAIQTKKCEFFFVDYPIYLKKIADTHFLCHFDYPDKQNLMSEHIMKNVTSAVEVIHFSLN